MRSDRYTKVVLTVIAVGLWALTMTQVGSTVTDVYANPQPPLAQDISYESVHPPIGGVQAAAAAAPSLPLRWRVRHAALMDNSSTDCLTIITVRNLSTSATTVEIEWFNVNAVAVGMSSGTIPPSAHMNFTTYHPSFSVNSTPFTFANWLLVASDFEGSAQVHSSDPRISVAAFLKCDASPSDYDPSSITNVTCDPVGATAEYFVAGMPAGWAPPMAVPEIPE